MRKDVFFFIFILGVIALNWPLLKIFNASLPLYLFTAWMVFILVLMLAERYVRHE